MNVLYTRKPVWETANSDKDKDSEIHLDLKASLASCMCTNFYSGIFITSTTISYLPPFCTLSGELSEDDRLFRMLLFMLLATCLYEESICCHSTTRLRIRTPLSSSHLHGYLIILICILCVGLILKHEQRNETLMRNPSHTRPMPRSQCSHIKVVNNFHVRAND